MDILINTGTQVLRIKSDQLSHPFYRQVKQLLIAKTFIETDKEAAKLQYAIDFRGLQVVREQTS